LRSTAGFLDLCDCLLADGHALCFRAEGWSMYPAVRDGDSVLVAAVENSDIRRGDVLLCRLGAGTVAHRVVRIVGSGGTVSSVILRGDSAFARDSPVPVGNIVGKVTTIVRCGRAIHLDTFAARAWGRAMARAWRLKRWLARARLVGVAGCLLAVHAPHAAVEAHVGRHARGNRSPDARTLLREVAGFSDADWSAIERGTAVAKILETDSREVAVAGAVRISAPPEQLITRIRDIEALKRSAIVLDAGRFSGTPRADDLAAARFEDYSLNLRDCRPGDCRVRLAAADIARFHRDVNWHAPDARVRSAAIWREVLAAHASAYVTGGRKALPVYANKQELLSVPTELSLLADKFGFVAEYSPEFHAYLQEFGVARPHGADDTLYWTKEDFGIRPVFRISHQVVYAPGGSPAILVATNQVYADHYLDAALGVTLAIDAPGGGRRAFYMVVVNRARTRSLSGLLRRMIRGTVQGRSRDALRKILIGTKSALESRSPAGSVTP
jgi:signal peptidase I